VTVRSYRDADREKWDQYVLRTKNSSCYHLAGWKKVIENSFSQKTHYLLSEDQDCKINGILPLVQLKSAIFGNFMISLPYFNYGGISADNEEVRAELLNEAIKIAEKGKAGHIEFRDIEKHQNGLPAKTAKVSMQLTFPGASERLFESLPSKLRSQIRKPEKEGMHARIGKIEELGSFYKVFSINMRDLGTPVYSRTFFQNILREFSEATWICSVYNKNEEPVASGFLVGLRETMEIPWASSLRAFNRLSPNMLLYWSVLKFACDQGYEHFDFGRSTPEEGTYKFKEQWGAKPVQLYWHYWLRDGSELPEINPKNPRYQFAIRAWQKLPVSLTKIVGPWIVKNLP
jgi:serine/alanine adding enzyme